MRHVAKLVLQRLRELSERGAQLAARRLRVLAAFGARLHELGAQLSFEALVLRTEQRELRLQVHRARATSRAMPARRTSIDAKQQPDHGDAEGQRDDQM